MKKLLYILLLFILTLWGSNLVSSFFINNLNISVESKISWSLFIDSDEINNSVIVIKSSKDISNYKFHSVCDIETILLSNSWIEYIFWINFLNSNCRNWNIYLKDEKWDIILNTNLKLDIISKLDLYSKLIDYSDSYLVNIYNKIKENKDKYRLFSNLKTDYSIEFSYFKKNRKYKEYDYLLSLISKLLEERDKKYLVPVAGYSLPTKSNKIPNAGRPYRSAYTDWIHHSWDIDTKFWEPVISISDSIVVRVVNNWKWSDFDKIKYWNNLTYKDKLYNLDILRWNQIWLKTLKGDVVFYGHLDRVYDNIKKWDFIKAWVEIWKVWMTWVPDKSYTDYHLDYSIHKNPYDIKKAWSYKDEDYMMWDWYFKWESREYILNNQYNIFYN